MRRWIFGQAAVGVLVLCGLNPAQAQRAAGAGLGARPAASALPTLASPAVQDLARRVLGSADHGHRPFAIVDKQAALLAVYRADGTLAAVSAALLGRDIGDLSVPGVGDRAQTGHLRPGDATTPGGRFVSSPGRNRFGEAVVWVDFSAAFAIHRLRPGAAQPDRARRLASANPRDKRVSAGCVVVPAAFYLAVVEQVLGRSPATVYVLPESRQGQTAWAEAAARRARSLALASPPGEPTPVAQTSPASPAPETPRSAV